MIKACEILQIRHIPCFAHSINLTVQDCLATKKVKPILEKCNTLFRLLKVKRPTRWNSAYYMVDRISITKVVIVSVLLNSPKGLKPLNIYSGGFKGNTFTLSTCNGTHIFEYFCDSVFSDSGCLWYFTQSDRHEN